MKLNTNIDPLVAVIMGSDSDLSVMEETAKILDSFEVPFEMKILSAHRTPEKLNVYLDQIVKKGVKTIICGAGAAAHLAGTVAARVYLPVIGVPLAGSPLKGLDALLATVQMPGGIPVATVGVGKSGATNAALIAIQILALDDDKLKERMLQYRLKLQTKVDEKNEAVKNKYKNLYSNILFND